MDNAQKIEMVRDAFPITWETAYMNTGTCGPVSTISLDALREGDLTDFRLGRGRFSTIPAVFESLAALQTEFSHLLGCSAEDVAVTHSTTEGMNIVLHGLDWRRGDEIITTNHEHHGGIVPMAVLSRRHGVKIRVVALEVEDSAETIVSKFEALITKRTRMFLFSHVLWSHGIVMPMKEICDLAQEQDIITLVDGAQSIGAIPLSVEASGVDAYAFPGQKWLCGPEDIGGLYVRKQRLTDIEPTFTGFMSLKDTTAEDVNGYYLPAAGAKRFQVGLVYRPAIQSMLANLRWLRSQVGWEWIFNRITHLSNIAYKALQEVPGVEILSPTGTPGLITFTLDGYEPIRVVLQMEKEGVVIRSLDHPSSLRASIGFYNSEAGIEKLCAGLKRVSQMNADDLPIPLM